MEKRIIKTMRLSYLMTEDMPPDRFTFIFNPPPPGGVTLIPDDSVIFSDGMTRLAEELGPLISKRKVADFQFEYVSMDSVQKHEINRDDVKLRTRFWRQVPGAINVQNAVRLSVQQMKNNGMYDKIAGQPINELPKPMFAFKVIEMMVSCGMKLLADELISYVGVDKSSNNLRIDSAYKAHQIGGFGGLYEYNWGCVLLKRLNQSLYSDIFKEDGSINIQFLRGRYVSDIENEMLFLRGRYIAGQDGHSIIKRSNALRRSPRIRGPVNCGNPLMGDENEEVLYELTEYYYDYGMYGSKDSGPFMLERDDQDAVIEFAVS